MYVLFGSLKIWLPRIWQSVTVAPGHLEVVKCLLVSRWASLVKLESWSWPMATEDWKACSTWLKSHVFFFVFWKSVGLGQPHGRPELLLVFVRYVLLIYSYGKPIYHQSFVPSGSHWQRPQCPRPDSEDQPGRAAPKAKRGDVWQVVMVAPHYIEHVFRVTRRGQSAGMLW